MMAPPKGPKKRDYKQHQLHTLRKALALVGPIDEWPPELMEIAEALRVKRDKMVQEQGGLLITEIERDAIDAKLQVTVLRGWVWNYIKGMGSPINKVKRRPFQIMDSFVGLVKAESEAGERLNTLRERRPRPPVVSLNDYLTNGKSTPPAPSPPGVASTPETTEPPTKHEATGNRKRGQAAFLTRLRAGCGVERVKKELS